jgi:P-type Cu+ transporter
MTKKKITIEGMHCASCIANVERSLKKIPGVKEVSVSLITHKAIIEIDDKVSVKDEQLKDAIKKVGYKPINIE